MQRDLNYWIDLLVRRRNIALEVGAAVFGLILVATMLWPPVYQSTAKILVQDNRAQYLVSPDLQGNSQEKQAIVAPQPVTQADLNSEVELLTSTYLIKQALEGLPAPIKDGGVSSDLMQVMNIALNLPSIGYESIHSTPALSARDAWALKLERHLSSSPIKQSNMIEVNFKAHDPVWTKDFLNRLLNEYLVYHAHISHDPEAERFFNEQAQILQAKLYASEDKLREFSVQNGITDVKAQKQALVTRLSDLQIQYARTNAALAADQQQVASLQNELKATPQDIGKEVKQVQNAALAGLKPQVMQLRAERAELLSRYQPSSQRIKEIDAKIEAAERILNREDHLEVQEKSTDLNPIWVTLSTSLEQARTKEASDQGTLTALQAGIQNVQNDVNRMTVNAVQYERLARDVTANKEAYTSYVRKSEEARTAQALNINKILNVSIAQPPAVPLEPVFPRVFMNLAVGLALAILLGGLAAYWEELQDDRIYSSAVIAEVSGLSTVAILRDEA